MKSARCILAILLTAALPLVPARGGGNLAWDAPIGAISSRYTEPLRELLRKKILIAHPLRQKSPAKATEKTLPKEETAGLESYGGIIRLGCFETQGEPLFMGMVQELEIEAPIERVSQVLERVDQYAELFQGYAEIKVVSKKDNLWRTHWEQRIPIPFVRNIRYDLDYLLSDPVPALKLFRYQLIESTRLKASDGAILLRKIGPNTTQYNEWDFYDADWGIAASFGRDRLWREGLEGAALSDLAIKLKAENPAMTENQARDAAESLASDKKAVFKCHGWKPASDLFK